MPATATPLNRPRPGRRTIVKGAAWAVPAVTLASAAPAVASSPDPGINGWVLVSYWDRQGSCNHGLEFNSDIGGVGPDGNPYGLYIYDVAPTTTLANAQMVVWIRGSHGSGDVDWDTEDDHHACWGNPSRGTPVTKSDGKTYTPYTWTYGCTIDPDDVSGDGRLYLRDFNVSARFNLPWTICNEVCYWVQRRITVDGEVQAFERKRGFANCSNEEVNGSPRGTDDLGERLQDLQSQRAELEAQLTGSGAQDASGDAALAPDLEASLADVDDQIADVRSQMESAASEPGFPPATDIA